jgi:hypothetical protein
MAIEALTPDFDRFTRKPGMSEKRRLKRRGMTTA